MKHRMYNSIGNIDIPICVGARNYTWRSARYILCPRPLCDLLRAKLSEYEAPLRRDQRRDHRSQALTVMWRRIFRGTLSAACELTVRTAACALWRLRGSYIIIMQHVLTHVRAPESFTIISLCIQCDLCSRRQRNPDAISLFTIKILQTIFYRSFKFIFN